MEAIEVMLRPKPRPQPDVRPPTGRPQIQVNARFDREIIADAVKVLVGVNDPPTLFMRGSEFVYLAPGKLETDRFDVPRLRGLVDELADCVTITASEDGEETHPSRMPFTVCQDFLVKPLAQAFPSLAGIRTAPVFLPDGRLLAEEGYDPDSGYLLRLGGLKRIRSDLSSREALKSLDDLLTDFPLIERYSRAHILALILEPFIKPLVGGLRWWVWCPGCLTRRRILYYPAGGPRFACRLCHGLTYRSSQEAHRFDRGIYAAVARDFGIPSGPWTQQLRQLAQGEREKIL